MSPGKVAPLCVGVDFDNTIICYDELFHRVAGDKGLLRAEVAPNKAAIRDYLRSLPDGNTVWTELQAEIYGARILEATPAPGVEAFFEACRRHGVPVVLISHKTIWPALGPRLNLRDAATSWLASRGWLRPERFGDGGWPIHFESTRQEKVARIGSSGCTHFVDDLEETFLEPDFPRTVERLLYSPEHAAAGEAIWKVFASWDEVREYLLG